jgi:hypothetical protein
MLYKQSMRPVVIILFFIATLIVRQDVLAQTMAVSGSVSAANGGSAAATISLLNAKDSSWIRSELADE